MTIYISLNLHTYFSSNPINFFDPSGHGQETDGGGSKTYTSNEIIDYMYNQIFNKTIGNKIYFQYEKSDLSAEITYSKDGYTYTYALFSQDSYFNGINIEMPDGFKAYGYELIYTNEPILDVNIGIITSVSSLEVGSKPVYKPIPKHDPASAWGSPNPIPDIKTGQEVLDTAYSSSKTKQLYNYYDDKLVKFQPDTVNGWHSYEVVNPAKEVPADVLRKMLNDGKITNAQYKNFIKNK